MGAKKWHTDTTQKHYIEDVIKCNHILTKHILFSAETRPYCYLYYTNTELEPVDPTFSASQACRPNCMPYKWWQKS